MSFTRKGSWVVHTGSATGPVVSSHTNEIEALESAVKTGVFCVITPPTYEVKNDWKFPTPTPSPTASVTPTPTPTPTATATPVPTASATPTPTPTATATPTPTPTATVVVTPTPTPVPTSVPGGVDAAILTPLLKFAETASRNWNFEGHVVDSRFDANYGLWDYTPTTYEPWLFNRPESFMHLFRLTNDNRWRTQAESDAAWYTSHIDTQGIFTPKGFGDTKYSYILPWATTPLQAQLIFNAWLNDWPSTFNRGTVFWTEREMAFSLEAAVFGNDMGISGAKARADALLNHWDAACVDGAPQVTYTQHEGGGPGGTTPTNPTNSPWMSALYFQSARKYQERFGGTQVLRQASAYFDWLDKNGFYPGELAHVEMTGIVIPRYLTGELIGDAGYDQGNIAHALDVGGFVKFAISAKRQLGLPTAAAEARLAQMKATALWAFNFWTREAIYLPKYRLAPPRMFNWWVRGAVEMFNA